MNQFASPENQRWDAPRAVPLPTAGFQPDQALNTSFELRSEGTRSQSGPALQPPLGLSVIVPAYNEALRIAPTLGEMTSYLDARPEPYEIIVVDDGSRDRTAALVEEFQQHHPQVKLMRVAENRGKGNAVRTGMLAAAGRLLLFADADGSTPIAELARLEAALGAGADLAMGSRAMRSEDTHVSAHWWRKYPGRIFNFCVNRILGAAYHDTQCGFKLFSADAAKFLFARQSAERFSFDVELLMLAGRAGVKVSEVPVNWKHVAGSKVSLLRDGPKMLLDAVKFRILHRSVERGSFQRQPAS